jgi:uncharacterized protein (DUF1800 family)
MALTEREKIAHLYRRFSFGGTVAEIEAGVAVGLDGTIKKLIDYDTVPQNVTAHPYEFAFKEKEEAEFGIYRFRLWWVLLMAASNRPAQEKLSLFWHSHFAVSDAKVEHAGLTLEYLQTLRKGANGKFGELLKNVAKNPAMMKYLDMDRAFKGHPNENFAREVMELFTMGIGNYTEKDVQELSRALTGWGYIDTFWQGGKDNTERLMTIYRDKRPSGAFCYFPTMRDTEPKTILGQTKDFDGDQALDMLAARPETARYMTKKLWEFYAYKNPEPAIIDRLAGVWNKTGGDIKQILLSIARSPEFYSDKCYLKHYKSPADYVMGTVRQMGLGESILALRDKGANPTTPIPQKVIDHLAYMQYLMFKMGLDLCYPNDVNGWKWGEEWVSPSMMTYRMQYHGMMIWDEKSQPWYAARNTQSQMLAKAPTTGAEAKKRLYEIFDLHISPSADQVFQKVFDSNPMAYKDAPAWSGQLYLCLKLLSACPDMHVC